LTIQGTEIVPLPECLHRYSRGPIAAQAIVQDSQRIEKVNYEGLLGDLQAQIEDLQRIQSLCLKGLKNIKKFEKDRKTGSGGPLLAQRLVKEIRNGCPITGFMGFA